MSAAGGVVLVAHSKGGLIGKHMMLVNDTAGRIDRLVAITTPFGGSRYPYWMLDPTLRAFRPTDRTMSMLAASAGVNTGGRGGLSPFSFGIR